MTGETIVNVHVSIHIHFEIAALPSQTMIGARFPIPVQWFLMFARVVVGETYDRRNHGQLSCSCSYTFCVTGRVVVGETYDRRDDDRCLLKFRKPFEVACRVVVAISNAR